MFYSNGVLYAKWCWILNSNLNANIDVNGALRIMIAVWAFYPSHYKTSVDGTSDVIVTEDKSVRT